MRDPQFEQGRLAQGRLPITKLNRQSVRAQNEDSDDEEIHAQQDTAQPASAWMQLQRVHGNRFVQRVVDLMRSEDGEGDVGPEIERAIHGARGGGHALDSSVRARMEPAFKADFGGVRVHTDSRADALNRSLSARAFTTGQDIFFKQGEYSPGSSSGRELLAHELTHVVQQNGNGVQLQDGFGRAGDRYEQHANQVAKEIVAGRPAVGLLVNFVSGRTISPVGIQGQSVQFWGAEHADFTQRAVERWNIRHPKGTNKHIAEHLKTWMVKCSDDADHTGRAFDILTPGNESDLRIYGDFIIGGKKRRRRKYAKADPAKKKKIYDAAYRSVCASEGPSHGEGNRPNYGSGGRAVNHAYMMSQIRWADRLTFGKGFMSRAGAGQLGDAMHCAQDRGSHCEGNRHEGHDDVRDKLGIDGYDTDDPAQNTAGKEVADRNSDLVLAEFAELRSQ